MFDIPPAGHPARAVMGDMANVVETLDPRNIARLPEFSRALASYRRAWPHGARRVTVIVLRADDERWLIGIGPRGGWRRLWNFGTGR